MNVVVIDIGNTSCTVGLSTGRRVIRVQRVDYRAGGANAIEQCIRKAAAGRTIDGAAVASVVPSENNRWAEAVRKVLGLDTYFISHRSRLGIPVTYPRPSTIGADRLANAAGAADRYAAPLIVGDFGTATTFDVVSAEQGYIGGVIAPGPALMFDYLAEKTALLPSVSWSGIEREVGKSTREAMQLGAQWGYRGLFMEIIRELKRARGMKRAMVIATGGYAPKVLKGASDDIVIDPALTLHGIGVVYALNRS